MWFFETLIAVLSSSKTIPTSVSSWNVLWCEDLGKGLWVLRSSATGSSPHRKRTLPSIPKANRIFTCVPCSATNTTRVSFGLEKLPGRVGPVSVLNVIRFLLCVCLRKEISVSAVKGVTINSWWALFYFWWQRPLASGKTNTQHRTLTFSKLWNCDERQKQTTQQTFPKSCNSVRAAGGDLQWNPFLHTSIQNPVDVKRKWKILIYRNNRCRRNAYLPNW